jgi:hypothetical protein
MADAYKGAPLAARMSVRLFRGYLDHPMPQAGGTEIGQWTNADDVWVAGR